MQADFTIGIDLGGTSTRVGLFDAAMELRGARTVVTRVAAGPDATVAEMATCVAALRQEAALSQTPCIGIGSPGPIDLHKGVLGSLPNFPGWDGFPLRAELERATHTRVFLESDANAAALAEWKLGAGQQAATPAMAMITLGTGVGSGIILNNRIWHGTSGMAGEVGHATVHPEGEACTCGSKGCLELYTSARAVTRFYSQGSLAESASATSETELAAPLSARQIAAKAQAGDPHALGAYEKLGHFLGIGVANLLNTLDLPLVVVGGGVAEAWALFAPAMFRAVGAYSVVYRLNQPANTQAPAANMIAIVPAALGPAAGLIGAALVPGLQTP